MAIQFGSQQSQSIGGEYALFTTHGKTVWETYYNGGGQFVVRKSTDQLSNIGGAVTVDSTAGNTGPPLNNPISYDVVTGRLHVIYARFENSGANNASLFHKYSDDQGSTWSAEHTIDNGSGHTTQMFVRAAIYANNGHVTVFSTFISNTTFVNDGLYRAQSSDGGATWGSNSVQYGGTAVQPSEPNIAGDGQYVIASWYDSLSGSGGAGNLYCAISSDSGATWDSSSRLIATGSFGRPRPDILNGYIMIVANSNWGGSIADVSTVRSTDLGANWESPVVQATHGAGPLDHPDLIIVGEQVYIYWVDQSSSPITYGAKISTDKGVTFGSTVVPLTQTGTSDAPFMFDTDDYVIFKGDDGTAGTTIWSRYPAFAALPGSIATSDDFNRANENPLSGGGNWTTKTGDTNRLKLVTNAVQRIGSPGSFTRDGTRYTATTISANNPSAAKFTVVQVSSDPNGDVDIYFWNNTGTSGYACFYAGDGSLNCVSTGAGGFLGQGLMPSAPLAGDQIEFQIDVDDLIGWVVRSGDMYELFRFDNTDQRLDWQGALEIADQNDTPNVWRQDDFGIAQLVVPANTVVPTISGTVANSSTLSLTSNGTWTTANGATPYRWTYQWQTAPDGSTWSSVSGATLWFYVVTNSTLYHRCLVTAANTIGSTSAPSSSLSPSGAMDSDNPPIGVLGRGAGW